MTYLKSNYLFEQLSPENLYQHVPHPLLIADHLMTPDNLGALIRLADNIGASEVCFLGKEEEHRLGKVRRVAASSRDNIHWYFSEENDLRKIVPAGKRIVAIETADNATCIYETQLPEDVAFIVGSESQGLSENLLAQCDMVVYIPVPGPTRSLNVSHAAAVALFEWQRQMRNKECRIMNAECRMKTSSASLHSTFSIQHSELKYKHIFFDLDRTLWDFDAAAEVAFERIYEKYNLKVLASQARMSFTKCIIL